MKLAIIALVATAAAADASDYALCKSGADCGGSNICCLLTKKADLADAPPGTSICVPALGDGVVPTTLKSGYAGFTYYCSKEAHTDPTNPPDAPSIGGDTNADGTPKASGAATIAVSATSAAVAAFMLA